MKFLLNTAIIDIGPESDPFRYPGFPLTREQYQGIKPNDLVEMLAEELRRNPAALQTAAQRIKRLLFMLHDKAKVNALRLSWEGAAQAQFGQLPELAFAGLESMAARGALTMAAVDESVWTKLKR